MQRVKKIFSVILRISISAALLVLLFKFNKIDPSELIADIKGANKFFLAAALGGYLVIYILGFLRWRMLLEAAGITVPFKKLISSFSGGLFFNVFLPSTIGGDLVRTVDLAGHTKKIKGIVATVFLDRLSGYMGMVFVVLPALLIGRELVLDKVVVTSVLAIISLLVILLLVLFNSFVYSKITGFLAAPGAGKIRELIKDIHQEIHIFRNRKRMIIFNLGVSLFIQLLSPVCAYFIGISLGVKISPVYYFIFMPIIGAITLLPIAIGGLGLREGLFVVYFAKAGVIKQLALAMSLLSFSFVVFYAAIGGIIYVLTVRRRRLQSDQPSPV